VSEHGRYHEACTNCGAPLSGPYCAQCGQRDEPDQLTTHHVWHEVAHELFHADGRIVTTLSALLLKPGFVTREYLDGRRARFVPPLRLYLTCSVIYFLLSPMVSAAALRLHPLPHAAAADSCPAMHLKVSALGVSITPTRPGEPQSAAELDSTTFTGRLVAHASKIVCHPEAFEHSFLSALPKLLFLYVPLFAFLMQMAYRARQPSYVASLVFALHFHAVLFIVFITSDVLGISGNAVIGGFVAIAGLLFTSWQYYAGARYAYGGSATETTLKTSVVGLVYGALFAVGVMGLMTLIVLRM
jgi:hypothetical protein